MTNNSYQGRFPKLVRFNKSKWEVMNMKKNFQTEIMIDNSKVSLNHFVQETLANTITGILKTLKETEVTHETIEIKIKRLKEPQSVDAHTYP